MRPSAHTPYAFPVSTSDCLNLVRGASAQLVLFGHAISFLGVFEVLQPPSTPYLQNVGVVAFFFISGIVISYTIEIKTGSYQQFILDRSTRIFTALIPALFFVAVVDRMFLSDLHYVSYAENSSIKTFVGNIALLAEYPSARIAGYSLTLAPVTVDRFGTIRPIWSVILECWLYVFFGYLFLSHTVRSRIAVLGCAVLFAFSILPVLAGFTNGKGSGLSFVWLLGAVYYRLMLRTDLRKDRLPAVVFGLGLTLVILAYGRSMMSVSEQGYDLRYSLAICFAIALSIEAYRDGGPSAPGALAPIRPRKLPPTIWLDSSPARSARRWPSCGRSTPIFRPAQSARAVIPTIITQLAAGARVELGALRPTRDFSFVADTVARPHCGVAESPASVGPGRSISDQRLRDLDWRHGAIDRRAHGERT